MKDKKVYMSKLICKIFRHNKYIFSYNGIKLVKWCWRCKTVWSLF